MGFFSLMVRVYDGSLSWFRCCCKLNFHYRLVDYYLAINLFDFDRLKRINN